MWKSLLTLIQMSVVIFAASLPNTAWAEAEQDETRISVVLRTGFVADQWAKTTLTLYPSMHAACGGATRCSHADALWHGGDVIALTGAQQWLEIDCSQPTSTLAIQFQGDDNDGWAHVYVDGDLWWVGNTYGDGKGGVPFLHYLEVTNLPRQAHTIRVEATGQPGIEGGSVDVAVAASACGLPELEPYFLRVSGLSAKFELYLPTIDNATQLQVSGT